MSEITWTYDGYYLESRCGEWEFTIEKTSTTPYRPIPRADKWSLQAISPHWYISCCRPTRKACMAEVQAILNSKALNR